jgi:crotonobetainyl-CoA:carnitine CoA-transferase CaiB-like acyl-CoA transferase
MPQALAGLRVLDFTTTIAGPHCTRLMADLGAEVIKIEAPEGDMMRTRPPLRSGASTSFGQLNAGKKSVLLDLKQPAAIEAVCRLVKTADVLVENFRPGVMQRLGLEYDKLKAINPRLVYCAISGYGQTGPSADRAAYAPMIHAASGFDLANMSYQEGRERPDYCGVYVADVVAGTYAFGAIQAALNQRHATGQGQMVDVSMLESMLSLTLTELQLSQFDVPRVGRPPFGPVATKDGYIMPAIASEKTFQALAHASGHAGWITDKRFALYNDRRLHWNDLFEELERWSRKLTTAQCQAEFDKHGVPASAYRTVAEALKDPQIAHRDALAEVHDAGGSFKVLNPPFRLSAGATQAGARVAALGEHTREVLAGVGCDALAAE